MSPATSGRRASRVIWSPLTAATMCRSSVIPTACGGRTEGRRADPARAPLPAARERPEPLDHDLGLRTGQGGRVVVGLVDVDQRVQLRIVPRQLVRQQRGVVELGDPAVPEQHPRPQVPLAQQALDQPGQRRPVAGRQRLPVAARHRQHDVHLGVRESAQHPADQRRVQEREVGRAHEGDRGALAERGQSRRQPLHRPQPLDRVGHHLDPGRKLGELLVGRGDDQDRAADGAREQGGRAVQQRRPVPLQGALGPAHPGGPAAGEDDTGGFCELDHGPMLGGASGSWSTRMSVARHRLLPSG